MIYDLDLTLGQEKFIALQQHLQNDFFIFEYDEKAYIIEAYTEDELKEEYSDLIFDGIVEQPFLVWVMEQYSCEEIPEIDDYSDDDRYRVLTDEEADNDYDDCLDNYIEECILSQIPESLRIYFDEERCKEEYKINGSRGESLSPYDGVENYESVNDVGYYIYKCN